MLVYKQQGSDYMADRCNNAGSHSMKKLPDRFTYLEAVDASIIQEIRYAGHHNFVGRPLPGYVEPRCVMTLDAALALREAQKDATRMGFTLKVYDAYRPQKAVDFLMQWCADASDDCMRQEFYSRTAKNRLVPNGYLAAQPSHCKGGAVDVTLVPVPVPAQAEYKPGHALVDGTLAQGIRFADNSIDMGTGFDIFDVKAHTNNASIPSAAKENRQRLKTLMLKHGFMDYDKEWWHFVLRDGPFDTAFTFDIT